MEQIILAVVPEDYCLSWQQGQEAEKPHFNPYTGSRRKNSKYVKTMNPQGPPPGMYFLQHSSTAPQTPQCHQLGTISHSNHHGHGPDCRISEFHQARFRSIITNQVFAVSLKTLHTPPQSHSNPYPQVIVLLLRSTRVLGFACSFFICANGLSTPF